MIDFIRSLFEGALKTNIYLNFAVVTGCLRISKESIFTGLNNLKIISILSVNYGEYYGFLHSEVKDMLNYYNQGAYENVVKDWYNGYEFGSENVYNPWSIVNYIDERYFKNVNINPKPYWSNTSSNNIVKTLIERDTAGIKDAIENLINGGNIEIQVREEIT